MTKRASKMFLRRLLCRAERTRPDTVRFFTSLRMGPFFNAILEPLTHWHDIMKNSVSHQQHPTFGRVLRALGGAAALVLALSGVLAEEQAMAPSAVTGHYLTGSGPSATELILADNGSFVLISSHNFSGEKEVRGKWEIKGSRVGLWTAGGGRSHRWYLEAFRSGEDVDLVPEETLEVYQQAPANVGSRYRRIAPASKQDVIATSERDGKAKLLPASPPPTLPPASSPVAQKNRLAKQNELPLAGLATPPPRPSVSDFKTIFISMPPPASPLDARNISEGMARLSVNERGIVTAVKILRSTGRAQFDSEAADTFRRWRANPGPAREVDVTLTSVLAGKPIPVRIPLNTGSMTSG